MRFEQVLVRGSDKIDLAENMGIAIMEMYNENYTPYAISDHGDESLEIKFAAHDDTGRRDLRTSREMEEYRDMTDIDLGCETSVNVSENHTERPSGWV